MLAHLFINIFVLLYFLQFLSSWFFFFFLHMEVLILLNTEVYWHIWPDGVVIFCRYCQTEGKLFKKKWPLFIKVKCCRLYTWEPPWTSIGMEENINTGNKMTSQTFWTTVMGWHTSVTSNRILFFQHVCKHWCFSLKKGLESQFKMTNLISWMFTATACLKIQRA